MQKILFFILLLFYLNPALPQEKDSIARSAKTEEFIRLVPLEFDEEKLQKLKKDPAFDYSERLEKENWWTQFKRYIGLQWKKFLNWLFGDIQASGFWANLLQLLPYVILLMSIGLLLFLFISLNPATSLLSPSVKGQVNLDEEENIIRNRNIKKLIEQAVNKEDYRLAVRYHFLYLLQQLSEKGVIDYNSSKTDEDYLNEITGAEYKTHFKKLNRIYDFIWYGHFEPEKELYLKIKKEFLEMEALMETAYEHHL